ncbi:diacylglycerol kinase [Sporosarcina sp. PTS2304]|uniref:diacylglycerol/lipid kinase family protein n=1 Tax=Sporosarcina sp. PTS2304 TaxID=2283194 RepID=UPI000E0D6A27|nr:YegS/Rv2252/BmrU family lipid kinase [Sporosarcina sp. PTS2304]AXH98323.1 diacylglycerol kinase [Sporosarcina sp. PTS2304]
MLHFDKALFVYNRTAGDIEIEEKLSQTIPIFTQAVDELIILNTSSEEELQQACINYSDQVDALIILGGDGTVHTCINSIAPLPIRPVIAILPGGTSNDFSRTVGIPQALEKAAHALINGKIVETDIGQADNRYFMNFWGIGLVTEASENVRDEEKKNFGPVSYALSTIRTLNQAEQFSYNVQTASKQYEGKAILLFVCNGRFIGTAQLPIPDISITDGKLDVLLVRDSNLSAFRELFILQNPAIDNEQLDELEYFQTDMLRIQQPLSNKVDMDGEIYDETSSVITLLPKHLRIIHPLEMQDKK